MKNNIIALIALLIFCSWTVQAQSQYDNEWTVSLGAGSSTLKYQTTQGASKAGIGVEIGAAYAHYFNKMIGISLGLEAGMFGSSIDMNAISFEQQIPTPQGLSGNFLLRANYNGLNEKQSATLLQIPVMLQFQFPVTEKSFFFLGTGIKAGFPVSSKWNQNINQLVTTGYSEYTGQSYTDMPNHGFSTYSNVAASGKLELKSPVLFALEGGLKFVVSEGKYLYAGVFLDYGLSDIHKASTYMALLEYNPDSPADYHYNSLLTTNQYSPSEGIKPFAVGVKIKMGMGSGKAYQPVDKAVSHQEKKPKEKKPQEQKQKEQKPIKEQKPESVWGLE